MAKFLLGLLFFLVCISPLSTLHCKAQKTILTALQEKPDLILYYLPHCPYSQKVFRHLESIHKTLPTRNLADDPKGKEELKEIGGKMQVPCLLINGQPLYESDAIIEWIDTHQDLLENST